MPVYSFLFAYCTDIQNQKNQVCFYVPALYATWRMTAGFTDHLLSINKRLLVIGLLLWTIGTAVEWAFNPVLLQYGIQLLL